MPLRLLCLLTLCSCLTSVTIAQEKVTPPNIVYILLDDAGCGDLSCYGQELFETPRIDSIAKRGWRFTDHYSGSTVCAPTRCSLMTGKHTGHCFVRGNKEVKPEGQAPMPADIVTLPRLLSQAGYVTGMFGKWGLGGPGSASDPMEHFDTFYGYNCQREAHDFYPGHLWSNRTRVELDGETYSHDLIAEHVLKFVRDNKDKPFFLYFPTTIPHAGMQVPEDSKAPFRKQFSQFENTTGKYAGKTVDNPVAAFAGMMTRLDTQVGTLLDLLEELGLQENTIVMLSSDNGPHQEGGHKPDFFNSNGPLRGHKRDLYDGGIRAPFLVMWPGQIEANVTSDFLSAHWDILPTCCEWAGVKPPADIDGISLAPLLRGETQEAHDFLYWEFTERGKSQAVRFGDWKAVRNNLKKNPNAPIELYNLKNDLGEEHNVADQHPELVKKALTIMKREHTPSTEFPLFTQK